ncbi:MAG TPA: hypothetical protein VG935_02730 [Patescibacteria group bacterium]|nr:hypothetical protein [Patescibacteria group bacterium]
MNIYISHSRSFDFKKELYTPILNSPLASQHKFILPHAESDMPFTSKELLMNKGCDLIIAEVSYPATGQGIELGWANLLNIPIVCIYQDGATPSPSLALVSSKMMMYTSTENMIEDITGLLRNYE